MRLQVPVPKALALQRRIHCYAVAWISFQAPPVAADVLAAAMAPSVNAPPPLKKKGFEEEQLKPKPLMDLAVRRMHLQKLPFAIDS